uniref:Rhomboid-related protein 3 n=1 Tax=Cacopsylla melanoneura TaxID=428564 RepID=A0A8D8Q0E9_9HEMI
MSGRQVEIPLDMPNQLYPNLGEEDVVKVLHHRKQKWNSLNGYVQRTVVPRHKRQNWNKFTIPQSTSDTDGVYEDEYSCIPPPVIMILISAIEVAIFLYDAMIIGDTYSLRGPMAQTLIYNPFHRAEAWRFVTYMFVHVGGFHLIVNLLVQILLGIPLEMVHRWWRVLIIYLAGVLAGSLATSITDPHVYLAGASGGVYALIAAHIATIIMNWSEMEFAGFQTFIFFMLATLDIGNAVYNRYSDKPDPIGYTAHIGGALAGLLVGIYLLRNLEVKSHERFLFWAALIVSFILFGVGIAWNVLDPSHWK